MSTKTGACRFHTRFISCLRLCMVILDELIFLVFIATKNIVHVQPCVLATVFNIKRNELSICGIICRVSLLIFRHSLLLSAQLNVLI